jgi:hypothetical protein
MSIHGRTWKNRPGEIYGEITIGFLSSGYYDPGKINGLPENCYPPEGEDERLIDEVRINIGNREVIISGDLAIKLGAYFQDEIDAEEISNEADEPDWDSIAEEREILRMEESQ